MKRSFLLSLLATPFVWANGPPCNAQTATTRREWGSLNETERTDYINAVWCMRDQPAVLPSEEFPGVRDRLDDYVACVSLSPWMAIANVARTHINYTTRIHNNGIFLPWHRHFLFLYERDLQQLCGYKGGIPYWDWSLHSDDLSASPVLDGSPTSLSGNGAPIANPDHRCTPAFGCLGSGTGGGCVQSGPFKDFQVHMGPFSPTLALPYAPRPADAFAYKPRCLTRNFNSNYTSRWSNETSVDSMLAAKTVDEFLNIMDPSPIDSMGAHGGGHQGVGGDMGDLFASPQDPVFMLHHSMVDRLWAMWQGQDLSQRRDALNGTTVIYDPPESPMINLETVIEFGVLDRPRQVKDLMDSMTGEYCNVYVDID